MSATLVLAVGGLDDAVGAVSVLASMSIPGPVVILTHDWGSPRIALSSRPGLTADFVDVAEVAPGVLCIRPTTDTVAPHCSALPALARALGGTTLGLLDPTSGAPGLARQIATAARTIGATELLLVDIGGKVLTCPRDDLEYHFLFARLSLAASLLTEMPLRLLITGVCLESLLTEDRAQARLTALKATHVGEVDVISAGVISTADLTQLPEQAAGLLVAAARGGTRSRPLRERARLASAHRIDLRVPETSRKAVDLVLRD